MNDKQIAIELSLDQRANQLTKIIQKKDASFIKWLNKLLRPFPKPYSNWLLNNMRS